MFMKPPVLHVDHLSCTPSNPPLCISVPHAQPLSVCAGMAGPGWSVARPPHTNDHNKQVALCTWRLLEGATSDQKFMKLSVLHVEHLSCTPSNPPLCMSVPHAQPLRVCAGLAGPGWSVPRPPHTNDHNKQVALCNWRLLEGATSD